MLTIYILKRKLNILSKQEVPSKEILQTCIGYVCKYTRRYAYEDWQHLLLTYMAN